MTFTIIVFITAFLMEILGSYISVVGLSSLSSDPIILLLAIVLDVSKIVAVSILYKYWDKLNLVTRAYLIPAVFVTVLITSAGAYGYLRETFQKAILPNTDIQLQLDQFISLKNQLDDRLKLIVERKQQIDDQIANLPNSNVRGRKQLIIALNPEKNRLIANENTIIAEINSTSAKITELKSQSAKSDNHIGGPVVAIAETFGIAKESAIKVVSGVITAIFDPLAIVLILCGNHILFLVSEKKRLEPAEAIRRELENSKLVFEVEKQKAAYEEELKNLKTANQPLVENNDAEMLITSQALQSEEIVEDPVTTGLAATEPKRKRKQKTDEPSPKIDDEKNLQNALDDLSKLVNKHTTIKSSEAYPDETEAVVVSGDILNPKHVTEQFAKHTTVAHQDNFDFYKSSNAI